MNDQDFLFLITIRIQADDLNQADEVACAMSADVNGEVITVKADDEA